MDKRKEKRQARHRLGQHRSRTTTARVYCGKSARHRARLRKHARTTAAKRLLNGHPDEWGLSVVVAPADGGMVLHLSGRRTTTLHAEYLGVVGQWLIPFPVASELGQALRGALGFTESIVHERGDDMRLWKYEIEERAQTCPLLGALLRQIKGSANDIHLLHNGTRLRLYHLGGEWMAEYLTKGSECVTVTSLAELIQYKEEEDA